MESGNHEQFPNKVTTKLTANLNQLLIFMNQKYSGGFKPLVSIDKSNKHFGVKQIAQDTLRIGDMNVAVELPEGEDLNEWLAVNTIEFYNEISL